MANPAIESDRDYEDSEPEDYDTPRCPECNALVLEEREFCENCQTYLGDDPHHMDLTQLTSQRGEI